MLFEILRRGVRQNQSLILPAGAKPMGTAYQESGTAGTAELAGERRLDTGSGLQPDFFAPLRKLPRTAAAHENR